MVVHGGIKSSGVTEYNQRSEPIKSVFSFSNLAKLNYVMNDEKKIRRN
jgi:hypothetical protein